MRDLHCLKPQDILVLLKMLSRGDAPYRYGDLALELGLAPSELSVCLERAKNAGLLDESKRKPIKLALAEFIKHGLRYVFPPVRGPVDRGIPTAHSAHPLLGRVVSSGGGKLVWPSPTGTVRGETLLPLYKSAPGAAQKDSKLYEWLVIVDAIRVGRAREKKIACDELDKRLGIPSAK